jgi:hypothetical protein
MVMVRFVIALSAETCTGNGTFLRSAEYRNQWKMVNAVIKHLMAA